MAWSITQRNKPASSTITATSITLANAFGSASSTANRILLFLSFDYNAATAVTVTVSDNLSSTWTQLLTNSIANGSNHEYIYVFTAVPASNGTMTITVLASSSTSAAWSMGWSAAEVSGVDMSAGAGCMNTSATAVGNSGSVASTAVACGTTAVDNNGDLAIGVVGVRGGHTLVVAAAGTGYTLDAGLTLNGDSHTTLGVATNLATATTESPSFTYASTAVQDVGECVVITMAPVTANGSINLVASASPTASVAATGAVSLVGSSSNAALATTTGAISLVGSASPAELVTTTGGVSLIGSSSSAVPIGATGGVSLTASQGTILALATTAAISLSGTATATAIAGPSQPSPGSIEVEVTASGDILVSASSNGTIEMDLTTGYIQVVPSV
jgi:hypothetical protein